MLHSSFLAICLIIASQSQSALTQSGARARARAKGYQFTREDFNAIQKLETGGCENPKEAVGDTDMANKAYGPYQITKPYYDDAVMQNPSLANLGPFPDVVKNCSNSEAIMQAYSNKYTTKKRIGRIPTAEDAARNHNGGPNGYKNPNTETYGENFKKNKCRTQESARCRLTNDRLSWFLDVPPCDQASSNVTLVNEPCGVHPHCC